MAWIGPVIGGVLGAMGSDSGGGSSQTQSIPPEFQGLANQVGQYGQGLAQMPYNPYPYSQVADFNPYQYAGFDMAAQNAMSNPLPGQAQQALSNQLTSPGQTTNVGTNPYAGSNPYLDGVINNTLGDMSRQFNLNVAPTEAANALKSGSFGNSGLAERADQNRYDLGKAMGNVAGGLRMQDYTSQQGLAENALNRSVNAQQVDLQRNQNGVFSALGQAGNTYALGAQPGQTLQGIGGTMQQQGQNVLNAQYGQYQDAQNYPFKVWDAIRSPFGGVSTGGTTTSSQQGSPVAGLLGGAMLGNQIGKSIGQPATNFGGSGYTGAGTPNDFWSGQGYY